MDPLRFRDPADDSYFRRPTQAMAGLSSGQSFFTVESLKGVGASSLPLLKPAYPHSAQQALFHVDTDASEASMRLLAADRNLSGEMADPRSRLLALENAVLLRSLSSETADPRSSRVTAQREALLRSLPRDTVDPRSRLVAADREALLRSFPSETADPRSRLLATEREALLGSLPSEIADPRSMLLVSERGTLLRSLPSETVDPRTRLLAAEREALSKSFSGETLDSGPRLLATERDVMLRSLPSETAEQYSRFFEREALLKSFPSKTADTRPRLPAAESDALVIAERDALLRKMHGKAGDVSTIEAERAALFRNLTGELPARAFPEINTRFLGLSEHRNHPDWDVFSAGLDARHPHVQPYGEDLLAAHPFSRPHLQPYGDDIRAASSVSLPPPKQAPSSEVLMRARGGPPPYLHVDALLSGSKFEANGSRVTGLQPANVEVRKQVERSRQVPASSVTLASNQAIMGKTANKKMKQLAEESEGWCAICKIDCLGVKNLISHIAGKKHKAALEKVLGGGKGKDELSEAVSSDERKIVGHGRVASREDANQAKKKRANNNEADGAPGVKRVKVTGAVHAGPASQKVGAINAAKGNAASNTKEVAPNLAPACNICNIFTTCKQNLETHLKGKRHAARVKELEEELKAMQMLKSRV